MVLESTMICLDNSDWMRNGDYIPSRLEAQKDAASLLCNDRLNGNPENTVGILSMAGQGVDLLVSPTEDSGKVLASFSRVYIGGKSDFITSVQIAQLALKHRKNKNGGQRIIAFIGGPIFEDIDSLQKIGKQLKKNNVAVSLISMGEIEENVEKLNEFVNATNNNENSHLITVPPGLIPADAIVHSPVMHSENSSLGMMAASAGDGANAGAGGETNFDMYGGIDPSIDPELAMVLRASAEEARAHEEARVKAMQEQTSSSNESSNSIATKADPVLSQTISESVGMEDDEDALIQQALELSMKGRGTSEVAKEQGNELTMTIENDEDGNDDDEDLRRALELSTATDAVATTNKPPSVDPSGFVDSDFVSQLLSAADPSDPLIQAALAQLQQSNNSNSNTSNGDKTNDDQNSKKRKGDDE